MSLISRNRNIMSGAYCIRGTRIPVVLIQSMLRNGDSAEAIAKSYGHVSKEQVEACRKFRRGAAREREK